MKKEKYLRGMKETTSKARLIKYRFRWNKEKLVRTVVVAVLLIVLMAAAGLGLPAAAAAAVLYALTEWADIRLNRRFDLLWTVLLYLTGAIFAEKCVQHVILDAENYAKTDRAEHVLNILLILALYLLVHVVTASPRITVLIVHTFCMLAAFTDYFVYQARQNEIVLSDIAAAQTGFSVLGTYHLALHDRGAAAIAFSLPFLLLAWKLNIRIRRKNLSRIAALAAALICGTLLQVKTSGYETQTWEQKGASQNGFLLNFALSIRDSIILPPEGYSEEAIEELEKAYGGDAGEETRLVSAGGKEPTIIVIMNESLADLSILGELHTNDEVLPFISSMHDNTVKGSALASVFGAKTPNSEWEFMSGGSMAFLPAGSVVYQQFLDEKPWTITDTLKARDYTTVAMHPYYASGWSRNVVYPAMGFGETYFLEDGYFDETKILRKYITDEELYNGIIRRFEEKEKGEKLFCLAVTMQNHGGYNDQWPGFVDRITAEPGIYDDVNQYLTLARTSDDAVRGLIRYFEQVDEPVEIVLFGDHQPSLNEVFYRQLNQRGMSGLTMDELEDFYTVPFFIWTNYDTQAVSFDRISLNYLPVLTLQRAGIPLPPSVRFLAEMMTEIPSINSRGYFSKSRGCHLHLDEAEGSEAEWIRRYRILQYNMLFEGEDRSEILFPKADGTKAQEQ